MEGIEALRKRTYVSDFSLQMNRSVAEYLRKFDTR
jgi:hypothetical protein